MTDSEITLRDLLRQAAQLRPQGEAIVDAQWRYSYPELLDQVRRMGRLLHLLGVRQGDRVALLMLPSTTHLIGVFGAIELGAIPCSLHVRESEGVLATVLERLAPRVLIYDDALTEHAHRLRSRVPLITRGVRAAAPGTASSARPQAEADGVIPRDLEPLGSDREPMPLAPDDTALIALSSGTTGTPKGIMHTHRTQLASARSGARVLALGPRSSIINLFSTAFIGWYNCTLPFLYAGAKIVFMSKWDPQAYLRLIREEAITVSFLVPTMWRMLLRQDLQDCDFSSLLKIGYAGERMDTATLFRLRERICPQIINTYGTTETGSWAGCTVMYPQDYADASRTSSVGRPVDGAEFRIIRPGATAEDSLSPGEQGEVIIRGPSVATRIWDQPEIAARLFEGPWWHSGDLGSIDADGYVYLHGRVDDMIISGGINVLPSEVEEAILGHPAVSECVVLGLPDEQWGQRITAFVIAAPGLAAERLAAYVEGSGLARYKRPREYRFVADLPRGNTGKVNRRLLRERLKDADAAALAERS